MKALIVLAFVLMAGASSPLGRVPRGLDDYMRVPEANPLTREGIARGRRLFFDKRLSRDRSLSCGSCHEPGRAFSDGRAVAIGIGGQGGNRNTPSLINRGYGRAGFWDGRAVSLEEQVLLPILNPRELGMTEPELEARIGMTATTVTAALANYIRSIRSGDSRFDRYAAGDMNALDSLERRGLRVFREKAGCTGCHIGPTLSDERFHNTGVAWRDGGWADEGRYAVSHDPNDRGAFKTPTLRDVARTAPYMHDGSVETLEEVVEFYAGGGRQNPSLDGLIRPRSLSNEDQVALVSFLRSLTGHVSEGGR